MYKQYNPNQRRVPAGNRDGGRWDGDGISNEGPSRRALEQRRPKPSKAPKPPKPIKPRALTQRELTRLQAIDPPIKPLYLLENAVAARAAARVARLAVSGALRRVGAAIDKVIIRRQHLASSKLDSNKNTALWERYFREGNWDRQEVQRVIRTGKVSKGINRRTGNPATLYEDMSYKRISKDDSRYIIIDDITNDIFQVSRHLPGKPFRKTRLRW